MTVVNSETGEILDAAAAKARAERISSQLDSAAADFEAAMSMLRAAIRDRDDIALGYRSPGDYLSDQFGGRLARLGVDLRRDVVRELTEAGMSTRAIAPVVGTDYSTVSRDRARVARATPETPESSPASGAREVVHADGSGQTLEGGAATPAELSISSAAVESQVAAAPRPPVTGIDGKTYSRPAPTQAAEPRRRPLTDAFFNAAFDLVKSVERITRLAGDDRFPQNAEKVAAKHRDDLLRARDALDGVLAQLP